MSYHQPGSITSEFRQNSSATDVVDLYRRLTGAGIELWLDGGWGVDALLEEPTRPHSDIDIVIRQSDIAALRGLLEPLGYKDVPRDDTSDWNFVLGDSHGHEVDVHAVVFDSQGNGLYGPPEKGIMYPADSLTGQGSVNGEKVKCVSPEYLVRFHTGYSLRDTDFHDVQALCTKFGLPLPPEYSTAET